MHDIRWIREYPDEFDKALVRRGLQARVHEVLALDDECRAAKFRLESALSIRKSSSSEIEKAMRSKNEELALKLREEARNLRNTIPALQEEVRLSEGQLKAILDDIPNLPLPDVPYGTGPDDNVEHHRFGKRANYAFTTKAHYELGEQLALMDFKAAARLSGARFVLLKGELARLERALGQFMIDLHTQRHGYTEINPPLIVRNEVMYGTAQLPKFAEDQFMVQRLDTDPFTRQEYDALYPEHIETWFEIEKALKARDKDQLEILVEGMRGVIHDHEFERLYEQIIQSRKWLIPTAEVPLTNIVRQSVLLKDELPLRFAALTPCFRAEAGAAGKDARGMIRQHQFDKVELVSITTPEQSRDEHERMLNCAEVVLRRLDLPYRVMTLCTGDMGFASQKTYDIEVWLPGQGAYREISSCSVCGEFQARRMNARYRDQASKVNRYVHTLNGSGVAVGRALIAVMENYQDEAGAIAIPEKLQPYMGGIKRIERSN